MIVNSSCDCCSSYDGNNYVVKCACGKESKRCSQDTIEEAISFAMKKGYRVQFPKLGEPGVWKCYKCLTSNR